MKNTSWITALIVLVIILVAYGIYRREFKKEIASDEVVIKKSVWDSIISIASMKPEIRIDTVYKQGKIVYVPKPVPTPTGDSIKVYQDSLVNPEVRVYMNEKVKGTVLEREWWYIPTRMEILQVKTVYVPNLVSVPTKVEVPKAGFYIYGLSGGNEQAFIYGAGIDYINKKDRQIGYQFQRFGDQNFHSLKYGIKIKLRR